MKRLHVIQMEIDENRSFDQSKINNNLYKQQMYQLQPQYQQMYQNNSTYPIYPPFNNNNYNNNNNYEKNKYNFDNNKYNFNNYNNTNINNYENNTI
jgi:hypothetical protein